MLHLQSTNKGIPHIICNLLPYEALVVCLFHGQSVDHMHERTVFQCNLLKK